MKSLEEVARRSGFGSLEQYLKHFKNLKRFGSLTELRAVLIHELKSRGLSFAQTEQWSDGQWLQFLSQSSFAKRFSQRMLSQLAQRNQFRLIKKNLSRQTKQDLSRQIVARLEEIDKNQSWLSKQLGVSREVVRQYVTGRAYPKKERWPLLESLLNIKVKK